MINVDISQWEEFAFGDLVDSIYKAKAFTKDELTMVPFSSHEEPKTIRYITRTADNNGCEAIVEREPFLEPSVEAAHAITIGDTTATCFYQDGDFIAGDHIVVVRAEWLNQYTGNFIVTLLGLEAYRYSYGRAFIMGSVRATKLRLPVCREADGNPVIDTSKRYHLLGYIPDWKLMENFIRSLNQRTLTTKNCAESVKQLNEPEWENFRVKDVFDLKYGVNLALNACTETFDSEAVNFVSRTELNNGVSARIEPVAGLSPQDKGLITVATGGSVLSTFVQPEPFYSGRDLYVMKPKDDTVGVAAKLFLTTVLEANRFKFNYGRQANKSLPYIELRLPIKRDDAGDPVIDPSKIYHEMGYIPDWKFMEDYIRSLPYGDRIPDLSERHSSYNQDGG